MSFLEYLKENRGAFIDHRSTPPRGAGVALPDAAADEHSDSTAAAHPGDGASHRHRRRRSRRAPIGIRYRHLRPAYAPLPYSDPLPYEPAWERAAR